MGVEGMPGAFGQSDALILPLLAMAMEAYLGGFSFLHALQARPKRWLIRLARRLRQKLDRTQRSRRARLVRGILVALFLVIVLLLAGGGLELILRNYPFAWLPVLLLLAGLLGLRRSWQQAENLRRCLEEDAFRRSRQALGELAQADLPQVRLEVLPQSSLAYAGILALSRRVVDQFLAPLLWYLLLSIPGLFLQQGLSVVAASYRQHARTEGQRDDSFALAVERLDLALNWLPERLAGILLAFACGFVPNGKLRKALAALQPGESWSGRAMLAGLGLILPGQATPKDLQRAQLVIIVVGLFSVVLVACLLMIRVMIIG